MTIYTKQVYMGMPYSYKIRKDRYWDKSGSGNIAEDTTVNITLTAYNGLDASFAVENGVPLVTINGGELPDYEIYAGIKGVLAPVGEYLLNLLGWYNYATVGTPNIDMDTGIVSGFSSGNYIQTPRNMPDAEYFDCIQKASFDGATSEQCIWFSTTDKPIAMYNGKLGIYQSGWHQGTTVLTAGIYWFRAIYDNGTMTLYYLADDEESYTLETLPEISSWNEELVFENCTNPFKNVKVVLSRYSGSYWKGTMYLDGSRISGANGVIWTPWGTKGLIYEGLLANGLTDSGLAGTYNLFYKNGAVVLDIGESKAGYMWCGTVNVTAHEVNNAPKTHFETLGNVTFSGTDASFASGAYLLADKGLPVSEFFAANLRFVTRVETGSDTSAAQGILWDDSSNNHGFGIYQNKFRIWNGSGHSGGTVAANTAYWVMLTEIVNEGSKLYYLVDDGTYTLNTLPETSLWTQAVSVSGMLFDTSGKKIRIGNRYNPTTEYWRGTIDLADTKIETDSTEGWTEYWRAVESA